MPAGRVKVTAAGPALTAAGPVFKAPSGDAQLEALLKVKAAIDKISQLKEWTRVGGAGGAYCKWRGVHCIPGTSTVYMLNFKYEESKVKDGRLAFALTGNLPEAAAFSGLSSLVNITFNRMNVKGTLPADWSDLTSLQSIEIVDHYKCEICNSQYSIDDDSILVSSLPESWGSFKQLRRLYIDVKLKGGIPASFTALASLEELRIMHGVTGSIPDLSPLSNLRILDLGYNRFDSTAVASMASWLPKMSHLEELDLHNNRFAGSIPEWLGTMTNLRSLYLGFNRFTGSIPPSLGSLTKLEFLDLSQNTYQRGSQYTSERLTGTLPDAFKALINLRSLYLQGNSLVGTVPASWVAMKSLRRVHLYDNPQLHGCMPAAWAWWLEQMGRNHSLHVEFAIERNTNLKWFC
jgi:hypothetical protein